jgi:hypothetical protein
MQSPRVFNRPLRNSIGFGAVTSLTLTFFHSVSWALVALFLGLAVLSMLPVALQRARTEPPRFYLAMGWTAMVLVLALAYGATQQLYNYPQLGFLLIGLVFGYLISIVRPPDWVAWGPFAAFSLYFAALAVLGKDPADSFPQNSRNYVSVVLLALYASAMLLSKPATVRWLHVLTALLTLLLCVWGTGRAGMLCAFLLTAGLALNMMFKGTLGIVRMAVATVAMLLLAVGMFIGVQLLQTQGYLDRFASRGFHDAPRLSILVNYFYQIEGSQLLFGKNYYHDPFMDKWGFNLHNTYLSAWAHLGLAYLLFILYVLGLAFRRARENAAISIAVLTFSLRALTDTHIYCGQYDYVIYAALFILLREGAGRPVSAPLSS